MALPSALFTAVAGLQQLQLDHNQLSVVSSRLLHALAVVMDLSHNLLQTECDTCLEHKSFQGRADNEPSRS